METYIEIVIDNSNSMGNCKGILENYRDYLLPDGSTRMELAKRILLNEIIPTIDFATKITVSLFHSLSNTEEIIQPVLYNGNNLLELQKQISSIIIPHNTGGTPITGALLNSINRLKENPNADRKIILVTDGQETDKKDYKQSAKDALNLHGINCNVFVVGISLDEDSAIKVKKLVHETGGEYINLKSNLYETRDIQEKLKNLKTAIIKDSIEKSVIINANNSKISEVINKVKIQETLEQKVIESKRTSDSSEIEVKIVEDPLQNEAVRLASETFLFSLLKDKYQDQLKWMNKDGESGKSFDFEIIDIIDNSTEYFIECKGTIGNELVFQLTKYEWLFFLQNSSNYQLYFVKNALLNPNVIKIDNFMKWLISGKVVPFTDKNRALKAERIYFTINQ